MRARSVIATGATITAAGLLLGWPVWAAVSWARYGHVKRVPEADRLLERYLPACEVAERHETRVAAPAALTYRVAREMGLQQSAVVRAIIRARERILRVHDDGPWPAGGIVAQMRAWGWGVLAEEPDRAVILGAVTRPWQGDVHFQAIPPDDFAAFDRPGYVKIVSTIEAEPRGAGRSIFRTQTRVATTDAAARARFRRYWAVFSPGILLIRSSALRLVKGEAERRQRESATGVGRRPAVTARPRRVPGAGTDR
ncbi:MAG: hypothetical protein ACYC2G_09510 [Gemmatimonadaceae bacterium]